VVNVIIPLNFNRKDNSPYCLIAWNADALDKCYAQIRSHIGLLVVRVVCVTRSWSRCEVCRLASTEGTHSIWQQRHATAA